MKLPNALESEKVVLSKILNKDTEALDKVLDYDKNLFFDTAHMAVFEKIISNLHTATDYDLLSLHSELENSKSYTEVGGINYLKDICINYKDYSFKTHFDIVRDKFFIRSKMALAAKILSSGNADSAESKKRIEEVEYEMHELTRLFDDKSSGLELVDSISDDVLLNLDRVLNSESKYLGLPMGFQQIDEKMLGLHRTDLTTIAARASAGKTAFYGSIINNIVLVDSTVNIFVFSLEMSKRQLVERLISSISLIPLYTIRTGRLSDFEWARFLFAMDVLKSAKIFIDDTPGINLLQLQSKIKSATIKYGRPDLVVVDYLQLMSPIKASDSRANDVGQMSRGLKLLAKTFNTPVMALSQLSRAPDKRIDHKPVLSDLKESSSVEQDSDNVIFIYREELYAPRLENRGVAEIIIAKQRQGEICGVPLAFVKTLTKFMNVKV